LKRFGESFFSKKFLQGLEADSFGLKKTKRNTLVLAVVKY